ncbi:MAG: glucosaminidase domain-containing protein [Sphingomonadales bacterium]|nr:glucosaminidase domain-containing protein [Sphingomonadales bacterium]
MPTSVTLAQFGLESAWGRRMPPGGNNPFGIKARPGEPFVKVDTWEQDRQGRTYRIEAKFRVYASLEEAFEAHAQLLQRSAYATARAARTADDYADALTGVYATDRQYGAKLKTLIRQHGLNAFDLP